MKRLTVIIACIALAACSGKYGAGVPEKYYPLLDEAFASAGDNAGRLLDALKETPKEQREGMAYLISYMPQGDLDTMDVALLRENVAYAYMARTAFPWAEALPDSIFLNEVLPYASVDEKRDPWRKEYYETFARKVAGTDNIRDAITAVNTGINETVGVEYNTLREKTNQSPSESMRQHMASCTGLSIILTDAFRSVGIPARFAGTAAWHDDRGNHSWVEVWIDGEWYFTEFYPNALNDSWFLADAGKATAGDHVYAVYATSYRPTGDWFPMVWTPESTEVHGTDVTGRYVAIYNAREDLRAKSGTYVPVGFVMYERPTTRPVRSGDRVAANVDVFRDGEQMGGGRTSGPTHDMNDVLTFMLEKNAAYVFRYENARGELTEVTAYVGDSPATFEGYFNVGSTNSN